MVSSLDGGGSEQQTVLLLRHLDRARFAPELYVLRRGGSLAEAVPDDVPVHAFDAATVAASWTGRLNWPGRLHRLQVDDVIRVLRERHIDVVYDRTFHMTLIAGPAAARVGVPRVSTIVSPPSRAVPLNAGRFLGIKRRRLATHYAAAAAVVAVSEPTATDARTYYALPNLKIEVIPNPVDAAHLDAQVAEAMQTLSTAAPDPLFTMVCVGRMTVEKGQRDLIEALAALRNGYPGFRLPRIRMIGTGPLLACLERRVAELRLQDQVEFLGQIPHPAALIAAADALCLPSRFEGFPNVMLEAMALGTPVIARSLDVIESLPPLPGGQDLKGRSYLTTFSGESPDEFAEKIYRLMSDDAARETKARAARSLAREAHAIDRIVPRIESLLMDCGRPVGQPSRGN